MTTTISLQPKIVERQEDLAIGIGGGYHEGTTDKIKDLWTEFRGRMAEIPATKPGYCLGVCQPTHPDIEKKSEDCFVYVAALPVATADKVPAGMVVCKIPAGKYAVFTHKGPISKIHETLKYIWGTWMPASEYKHWQGRPDFEYMDERFDAHSEDSEFDICVPLR